MASNPMPNPLPCGCRVAEWPLSPAWTDKRTYHQVEFCPLHSAAPDLLKALEMFMAVWNRGEATSESKRATEKRAAMWKLANAAVAKARPEHVKPDPQKLQS